jgi:superfamily II DNA or RNA helicase
MTSTKSILTKSKGWTSFKRTVDTLDNKQKGDAFEDLTQHFFQIDPKYRTKLKNVWNVNKREVPSRIHRKLNLPSPDLGIDLLAETAEGEFWAIQCKYHSDQGRSLKLDEVEGCMSLAFGHCKGISLAIICTSAEKYSRHLKKYAEEKLAYCDGSVWRRLDENFFKAVRKNLKGQSQPIKAFKPRPHQKRAIKNALDHFVTKKNKRGKMIMPCGSGKSLTGYWIANDFKAKKILVAVPSLALIKQTLEVWAEQSVANKKNVRWICVCSDKSVGDISNDDVAVQLQDLGIRIHTKPAEIASWLKKRSSATTVVFTTYHSGEAIAAASKRAKYSFDLGICDEAHKTVGAGGNAFSHLLYEKNIKVKRRLFMTATERRYGGSADKVISMDDHDLYGETFELLSFKEALECKPAILSDYKIITIGVTQQEIRENIKKNILVKPSKGAWNKETKIQMLTAALALRKAIKLKGIKHAVSFHSSIARAVAFRETQDKLTKHMKGYDRLDTFHVSGKLPTADREKRLNEFAESKRSLITNARCLTEGVDVKQIDCVVFADPKRSAVDIVQAVGRALRPYEGKKYGYVIVPQLIDAKSVKGRIEQNESFKDILMTLRALAANDERIVEYFRSVSEGKKIPKQKAPVEFVTPIGTEIDYKQFEEELKLKVWSRLAKLSWRPFEEARDFARALNFISNKQWVNYSMRPADIPASVGIVYKNMGWTNWPDFLGTKRKPSRGTKSGTIFVSFKKAKSYAYKLNLISYNEWSNKNDHPDNIPLAPDQFYRYSGWNGWPDFLGSHVKSANISWLSFKEAKKVLSRFKFRNTDDWKSFCSKTDKNGKPLKPINIPSNPDKVYKIEWSGWVDFLGYEGRSHGNWWSFEKARAFSRGLKLKQVTDWRLYGAGKLKNKPKRPSGVPAKPDRIYPNEFINYYDWCGLEPSWRSKAKGINIFREFNDAKKYVKHLGIYSKTMWQTFCRGEHPELGCKAEDIPMDLVGYYSRKGHNCKWGDFMASKNQIKN